MCAAPVLWMYPSSGVTRIYAQAADMSNPKFSEGGKLQRKLADATKNAWD